MSRFLSRKELLRDLDKETADWVSQAPDARFVLIPEPLETGTGGLGQVDGLPLDMPSCYEPFPREPSTVTVTADPHTDNIGNPLLPAHPSYGRWWEPLRRHRPRIRKDRHRHEFDDILNRVATREDSGFGDLIEELRTFYARYLHNEQANLEVALSEAFKT